MSCGGNSLAITEIMVLEHEAYTREIENNPLEVSYISCDIAVPSYTKDLSVGVSHWEERGMNL